jgi:hypothetical protein
MIAYVQWDRRTERQLRHAADGLRLRLILTSGV